MLSPGQLAQPFPCPAVQREIPVKVRVRGHITVFAVGNLVLLHFSDCACICSVGKWTAKAEYPHPEAMTDAYLRGISKAALDLQAVGVDADPTMIPLFDVSEPPVSKSQKRKHGTTSSCSEPPTDSVAIPTGVVSATRPAVTPVARIEPVEFRDEGDSEVEDGDSGGSESDDSDAEEDLETQATWEAMPDSDIACIVAGNGAACVGVEDVLEVANTGAEKEAVVELIEEVAGNSAAGIIIEQARKEGADVATSDSPEDVPAAAGPIAELPPQPPHTIPVFDEVSGKFIGYIFITTLLSILASDNKASADRAIRIRDATKLQRQAVLRSFGDHIIEIHADIGCVFETDGQLRVEYGRIERIGLRGGKKTKNINGTVSLQSRPSGVVIWCAWYEEVPVQSLLKEIMITPDPQSADVVAYTAKSPQLLSSLLGCVPSNDTRYYQFGPRWVHEG